MRPSRRKALLYQVTGLVLYLLGLVVFASVVVSLFAGGSRSLTAVDAGLLGASTAAIAGGRLISHRHGLDPEAYAGLSTRLGGKPDQTRLEELGYHIPPEAKEDDGDGGSENPDPTETVCSECGATNDQDYRFCRQCSAEL